LKSKTDGSFEDTNPEDAPQIEISFDAETYLMIERVVRAVLYQIPKEIKSMALPIDTINDVYIKWDKLICAKIYINNDINSILLN